MVTFTAFTLVISLFLAPLCSTAATEGNEFLDLDLTQLLDITITSVSKKPQNLSDAAAAVYVITSEDIKRSGVTSLPEALAMAPGLFVAQISASKWAVSSRGFSGYTSNKLLVLIDGRSVYSPAYSGTFWDMQNVLLEDIDRIEVIRGPGGTLWGANAVNGVINIITKKASETTGGLGRIAGGTENEFLGGARVGGKLSDSVYGRFSVNYESRDENVLAMDGRDGHDGWNRFNGGIRLDGEAGQQDSWMLKADVAQSRQDQLLYPFWIGESPYLTEKEGKVSTEGANILGRYQHNFNNDNILTAQVYYDYNDREEDIYQQTFNILDFDLQYQTIVMEHNNLTMGAGYRTMKSDFVDTFQVELADRSDSLLSAFVQDEITIVRDALWFTAGVKWEENDYTGTEWQPSGRVLWKPGKDHSLWFSVARAVRTPSMVEEDGFVTVASYPTDYGTARTRIVGNEQFESEYLCAYETGYRWQYQQSLSVDIALFYNDYEDLYTLDGRMDENGFNYYLINGYEGSGLGGELMIDWKPVKWFSLQMSYAYLNLDLEPNGKAVGSEFQFSAIENTSPENQFSLRGSYNFAERWQLNIWLRYLDEISALNSADFSAGMTTIDDYFVLNANIIWSPVDNLEIMFAGQNLLEDRQLQYVPEFITPATEIERGFYVKATYLF